MRIAFCGYDFFVGCLDAVIEQGHQVVALFAEDADNEYNFNKEILQRSVELDIPVKLSPINEADVDMLEALGCDVLISAAYSSKIPDLSRSSIKGINIHPTKLPKGRGPWPLPWLILKEETETALTFHKITQQWDGGDILHQVPVAMTKNETLESLSAKLQMYAPNALLDVLDELDDAWENATAQGEGEYWPMLKNGGTEHVLTGEMTVADVEKTVRAFGKFESRFESDGIRYLVERVSVWQEEHGFELGEIVHKMGREFVFAAKDGFVCVTH